MRRLSPTPAALSSAGALEAFFSHPLTTLILTTSPDALDGLLCNDLYKPRMHNVYARLTPGATLDFMLAIRHTPAPLATIQRTDPALWGAFQQACTRRLTVPPYPDEVLHALKTFTHGAFHFSGEAKERATHQPPAHLQWHSVGNEVLARASGPAEAASHVETTLTQAVQEVTLAAQVRALHGDGTATVSAEELLGSALARLAMGVDYLNKGLSVVDGTGNGADGDDGYVRPKVSLFAGRRSSSRRYLLLQNW